MAGKIKNAVATTNNNKTLQGFVKKMEPEIAKALPSVITPERFTRIVFSAISSNPELANTTPESFLGAMMTAAQLGLEPNTPLGHAYLLSYKNRSKGVTECQFQLGYKGLIDLAYRSNIVSIQAHEVCENDEFNCEYGLDPKLVHRPALENRGPVVAYYATFKTENGGTGFEVMSREDIEAHAKKYSKAFGSGPWQSNFDEMAKKTVLKRVLKYAPLRTDFVRAVGSDETIRTIDITDRGEDMAFEDAKMVNAEYDVQEEELAEGEIPLAEAYDGEEPDFMK